MIKGSLLLSAPIIVAAQEVQWSPVSVSDCSVQHVSAKWNGPCIVQDSCRYTFN